MEVEREFELSITAAAAERKEKKKILCEGCGVGERPSTRRAGERGLRHRRGAYQWSTERLC